MNANLIEAVNLAAAGIHRLADDVNGLADVLSMTFGLPLPQPTEPSQVGRMPQAVERLAGAMMQVAATCQAASGKLGAVAWVPRDPVEREAIEEPLARLHAPDFDPADLGDVNEFLDRDPTPEEEREAEAVEAAIDRAAEESAEEDADDLEEHNPDGDPVFVPIGPDGCHDTSPPPVDVPEEKTGARPRSRRPKAKKKRK